jgi:hypothetical protein
MENGGFQAWHDIGDLKDRSERLARREHDTFHRSPVDRAVVRCLTIEKSSANRREAAIAGTS